MIKSRILLVFFVILKAVSLCFLIVQFMSCGTRQEKSDKENSAKVNEKRENVGFNGILEFKINAFTVNDLSKSDYKAKEKLFDKENEFPDWKLLYTRKFLINKITFKKIELSSVELEFYRDNLINISGECNSELRSALKVKFPNYYSNMEGISEYYTDDECWTWYNSSIKAVICRSGESFSICDTTMIMEVFDKEDKIRKDYIEGEYKSL